jgi:cystathionine beta-lyase/cystathionine gamma-synthase
MNNLADTQTGSSDSSVLNNEVENKKAIQEIQEKLNEIMPSLNNSVNLTTIKDLELRVSNLEENVEKILKILESKKIE